MARAIGNSNLINSVAVNNFNDITPLNDLGNNTHILTTPYNSKSELDAVFPAGDFWIDLSENGEGTGYGPYNLPADNYPVAPQFSNFSDLETFDSSDPLTITWADAPGVVSDILVFVLNNGSVEWIEFLGGNDSSVQLPANTLTSDSVYDLVVQFRAPEISSTNPTVIAGYISQTSMRIQTA